MTAHLKSHALKKTLRVAGMIVAALLAASGISVLVIRVFAIRNIIVEAPGMSIELDRKKFGDNLLFIPADRLTDELKRDYPLLATVRFEKRYPSTLVVHLTKKQAEAAVLSGGTFHAVDLDGSVIGVMSSGGPYPVVEVPAGIWSTGSQITDPRVRTALDFIRRTKPFLPVMRVTEHEGASLAAVSGNTSIFIPQNGDMAAKASTLQTLISGFRIKGTLPTVIDLRFDKPIVTN